MNMYEIRLLQNIYCLNFPGWSKTHIFQLKNTCVFSHNRRPHVICTCADKEHVVCPLVQGANPIYCQPGEVDALGEQQGASQSFVLHQRVLLGKVERGIRQLQRAVVAILPVWVSYTLQHRQRRTGETWEGNGAREGMEGRTKGRVWGAKEGERGRGGKFLAAAGTGWHG